ncbi:hypothetical protein [Zavarzinella formosa]|uniref:hypothetical protein n=1 Tax=Zavarzinella formosa TaxID=360055 RepID=UPI000370BA30|nr:hypothetical protein [Zavarzinella formosa]
MRDIVTESETLAVATSWRATPDNYSSLRFLRFNADGSGELTYAYGQTIYAVVPCAWAVPAPGRLRLTYSTPIRGRLAAGFVLDDSNHVKELSYTLTAGRVAGVEDIVSTPYECDRTLELSETPWPSGLDLPYAVPRVFYGCVATGNVPDAEQGTAAGRGHQSL